MQTQAHSDTSTAHSLGASVRSVDQSMGIALRTHADQAERRRFGADEVDAGELRPVATTYPMQEARSAGASARHRYLLLCIPGDNSTRFWQPHLRGTDLLHNFDYRKCDTVATEGE